MSIRWNGGLKGSLSLYTPVLKEFWGAKDFFSFLIDNCFAEDPVYFEPEDLEIIAVAAMFMAIRGIAPTRRGNVLDSAAATLGGSSLSMNPGYRWLLPLQLYGFGRELDRVVRELKPFQADSQYALKCLAYELLAERLGLSIED